MVFHTLYDVRDDTWLNLDGAVAAIAFFGFALVWMTIWVICNLALRRTNPAKAREMVGGFFFGTLSLVVGTYMLFDRALPMYAEHRRCCRWLDEGQSEVIEGAVAEVKRRTKQASQYRVGETWFGGERRRGRFHWEFTAAGSRDNRLTTGMYVRVTFREGRVLRIESAPKP